MRARQRDGHLDLSIDPSRGDLAAATSALLAFLDGAGLDRAARYSSELVFDEIVPNILRYGRLRDDGEPIEIAVRIEAAAVVLDFVDDGTPFDPHNAPPPPRLDDLAHAPVGGFGLFLVREYAESIDYQRRDGRNHLRVRIRRAAA